MPVYLIKRLRIQQDEESSINGLVVREENEERARKVASYWALAEGGEAWTSPDNSRCIELTDKGKKGVLLFNATYK